MIINYFSVIDNYELAPKMELQKAKSSLPKDRLGHSVEEENLSVFIQHESLQAKIAIKVPSGASTKQFKQLALQKLGLPSDLSVTFVMQGKPARLGKGCIRQAGIVQNSTVSLVCSAALPGGVSVQADDEYQRMDPKRNKADWMISEKEEQQRKQKEEYDNEDHGFFSFEWMKEDKGILYDWAVPLDCEQIQAMEDDENANETAIE